MYTLYDCCPSHSGGSASAAPANCKNDTMCVMTTTVSMHAVLDYENFNEMVTFNVGDTVGDSACINVQISIDDVAENNEDFFVFTLITSSSQQEIEIDQLIKRVTIIDGEYQ